MLSRRIVCVVVAYFEFYPLFTDDATVKFEITIVWTAILKKHNESGSLQMFLKQEFSSLVRVKEQTK